jgi:hypothetical protein
MYNIIPLIIICFSLLIILVIVVRKFPALANLDVANMPAEKEARFKEKIISSRLHRNAVRWGSVFVKFFNFLSGRISALGQWLIHKLSEAKKNYNQEAAPATIEDKEEQIKKFISEASGLDSWENFEAKEKLFIRVIEAVLLAVALGLHQEHFLGQPVRLQCRLPGTGQSLRSGR